MRQTHADLPPGISPERLWALVDHSCDILSLLDAEGRLLYNSPAAERIHGFTPEEMAERNTFDFIHPEDQGAVAAAMGTCLKTPDQPVWVQYRYAHKTRGWMWMEAVAVNLLGHPEVGALVVNSRDISDRVEAQVAARALRESESRYRDLFTHMTQGFAYCRLDFEGDQPVDWTYLEVNPAFLSLTGLPDPTGRRVTEVIPGIREADPGHFQRYARVVTTGEPVQFEVGVEALGKWFSVSAYRPSEGHFIAVFDGITARKRAEGERLELERQLHRTQKLESLGSLAGGIAHDMNNVLGSILGLASLHQELEPEGSSAQKAFEGIARACQRGGGLVRRLLSFARQDLSEVKRLDLNVLIQEEVALLERTTLAQVRCVLDLDPGLRPVRGDAGAILHVLMNLCVNAVDAMPEGGTLVLRSRNLPGDQVEVRVEDTGCGMPPAVMEKALDPFFTTKPEGRGTGLGLAIVFGTMKAHQGTVELQSQAGQGTQVILRFPACTGDADESGLAVAPPTLVRPPGLQVLVVDDDELIRSSLSAMLGHLGHQATLAASGEEAVARVDQGFRPDRVILDMNMPGWGGWGTLPRLRERLPEVPVIIATGRLDQRVLELAQAHVGVKLLPKPFRIRDLEPLLAGVRG